MLWLNGQYYNLKKSMVRNSCFCFRIQTSQSFSIATLREILLIEREIGNPEDKYAVCVKRNECIFGHLPFGNTGNFIKTNGCSLRADD